MYYEVKIISEVPDAKTAKDGEEKARKAFKELGLKIHNIKCLRDARTIRQNSAMHLWFKQIASESNNQGQSMDMLIKNPAELIITETLLKDTFRLIGKAMFHKTSTADLNKEEFNKVQKVFEKAIAERLGISIDFPSIETMERGDDHV